MLVDFGRKSYALNPAMLRAVLNGYGIDMTKPCTIYEQNMQQGWANLRVKQDKMRQENIKSRVKGIGYRSTRDDDEGIETGFESGNESADPSKRRQQSQSEIEYET